MNLGKKLAEGYADDTETEEPRTGPIQIVAEAPEAADVTVEAPAEPATV
jgi:hypothetical protein